eukprot:6177688-Pleurochrysis_carterae.AAC.2
MGPDRYVTVTFAVAVAVPLALGRVLDIDTSPAGWRVLSNVTHHSFCWALTVMHSDTSKFDYLGTL